MKYVIDDIVTSFTDRIGSHRSAWPRMQKCMVDIAFDTNTEIAFGDQDLVKDGTWLVSTPMEFKGDVFNLFGGYTIETRNRIARVLDMDLSNIIALDMPIGDIERILRPRAAKTDFDFTESEWSKIRDLMKCTVIKHEDLVLDIQRVVIGDSHCISRYRANTLVYRHDGLTLHGLTERGVESYLPDFFVPHLVIYAGNVDIRHHLCRQVDPASSARRIVSNLRMQLEYLQQVGKIGTFEVTAPYPIEFEERKIPKTGHYKGTAFYGSLPERDRVRAIMTNEMKYQIDKVHEWPKQWFMIDPEDYAKTYMEKPGSVHLSPEFYEWDLWNNYENYSPEIYSETLLDA
jgi:hypothetical protein